MCDFAFYDEEGRHCRVEYAIIEDKGMYPYGIQATLKAEDGTTYSAAANGRFMTYEEAVQTAELLCRYRVTPCTLNDVI